MKITAEQIKRLLASKHDGDVWVDECKDGPTQFGSHMRMDGWAMKRSWRHPLCVAYEVKVSRSDFLADDKWRTYLGYCNEFYFVCPPGVIDKGELPQEAGLVVTSTNAARLYTKKKAPWRDVEIPGDLYRYILMCRTQVTRERYGVLDRDFWKQWLQEKNQWKDIGYRVSKRLRQVIKENIDKAEANQRMLEKRCKSFAAIQAFVEELGIDIGNNSGRWLDGLVRRQIERAQAMLPEDFEASLVKAKRAIVDVLEIVEQEKAGVAV